MDLPFTSEKRHLQSLKDFKLPFLLVTADKMLYYDFAGEQNQGVTTEQQDHSHTHRQS